MMQCVCRHPADPPAFEVARRKKRQKRQKRQQVLAGSLQCSPCMRIENHVTTYGLSSQGRSDIFSSIFNSL